MKATTHQLLREWRGERETPKVSIADRRKLAGWQRWAAGESPSEGKEATG